MSIRETANLAALLVAGILITACSSPSQSTGRCIGDEVDSIKVEVSAKPAAGSVVLTGSSKAIVRHTDRPESLLSDQETAKLKVLADDLFVKKTENIVLSETRANGRTGHPIFTVTLYRNGESESLRYDMGDEADGITQCTAKNICYSDSFREFVFSVFRILNL